MPVIYRKVFVIPKALELSRKIVLNNIAAHSPLARVIVEYKYNYQEH